MCENNNPLGNVTSRAACIRNLNGKIVNRTVGGARTIEDSPTFAEQLREHIKLYDKNAVLEEDEDKWYCGTRFWMKPKMHRVTQGEITFRSKDFNFNDNGRGVWGELKDGDNCKTEWRENGFIRTFFGGVGQVQYIYQLAYPNVNPHIN